MRTTVQYKGGVSYTVRSWGQPKVSKWSAYAPHRILVSVQTGDSVLAGSTEGDRHGSANIHLTRTEAIQMAHRLLEAAHTMEKT